MKLIKSIKNLFAKNPYLSVFFHFEALRLNLRLFASFMMNGLCVITNGVLAAVYRDPLLCTAAVYYAVLALMRFRLLRTDKSELPLEKAKRLVYTVGISLILLDLIMSAMVTASLFSPSPRRYNSVPVIPQALFLLFFISGALSRLVHLKRRNSVSTCVDAISFSAALFSFFNLLCYLSHVGLFINHHALLAYVGVFILFAVLIIAVIVITRARLVEKENGDDKNSSPS